MKNKSTRMRGVIKYYSTIKLTTKLIDLLETSRLYKRLLLVVGLALFAQINWLTAVNFIV